MIKMTVETITPAIAKEYLKKNVNNYRKHMNRSTIKKYAEDMKAGKWYLNGEAITFGKNGLLKNGQHRLAAIILAGVPVQTAVIRDVEDDINTYDRGNNRSIVDIVNADGDYRGDECNSTISAAANIVVNNFRRARSGEINVAYIRKHRDELQRAYRITCYGSAMRSKCAACVAATYLAIRTQSIPSYELELFFRAFNAYGNYKTDGYDPSSVIIARNMFESRGKGAVGYQVQKEKLEITTLAILDFHSGVNRKEHYKISEPFKYQEWMDAVRKEDGLEV